MTDLAVLFCAPYASALTKTRTRDTYATTPLAQGVTQ